MKPLEHKVDRRGWQPGPWDNEPDRVDWKTRAGYPAMIHRNDLTALCGYVGVPKGHPFYEAKDLDGDLNVHGGVTYTAKCRGHICHVPAEGEPDDVWWIGFDCAHSGDYCPRFGRYDEESPSANRKYRDVLYVTIQCEDLAQQLAEKVR